MAMPIPTELTPQARIDDDRPSEQPLSGPRVRRSGVQAASAGPTSAPAPAARAQQQARPDPDREAMLLMMKVMARAEVAKSFAKLAAGLLTVTAARASVQVRAVADQKMAEAIEREGGLRSRYAHVLKIARAARDAAVHVATHSPRAASASEDDEPASQDAPDTQEAPSTQEAPETQGAPAPRG